MDERESTIRQYQIRTTQLENEAKDKQYILDELSKNNLELKSKGITYCYNGTTHATFHKGL